jgi:hypothetical protein
MSVAGDDKRTNHFREPRSKIEDGPIRSKFIVNKKETGRSIQRYETVTATPQINRPTVNLVIAFILMLSRFKFIAYGTMVAGFGTDHRR